MTNLFIIFSLYSLGVNTKKMKNTLFFISFFLLTNLMFSQKHFVSRKQHINSINGKYFLGQVNTYFTIDGDTIINTDRKREEVFVKIVLGETKMGDEIIKWSFNEISEGLTGKQELVRRSIDTFTNNSSKIVYELTPKEE